MMSPRLMRTTMTRFKYGMLKDFILQPVYQYKHLPLHIRQLVGIILIFL